MMKISIKNKVQIFNGAAAWYFMELPKEMSDEIRKQIIFKRGWGAVRVRARIGKTEWDTSIFPLKNKNYFLALKKEVRTREKIELGQEIEVEIEFE